MSVKEKALELQKSFRLRENPLHRPAVRRAAALGAHFLLGFVTGSVRILENWGPFGVAMAARAGGGLGGLMCVLGAGTGYVLSGGFDWGLRYIAALLLVYTAAFILRDSGLGRKNWFMPLAAGAAAAGTGALALVGAGGAVEELVYLAAEALITGLSAYLFALALAPDSPLQMEDEEMRRQAGTVLILACVLMALARVTVLDVICLGRLVAVLAVMTAAFGAGPAAGAAAGVVAGTAVDLVRGGMPLFTVCYGFAGLISGTMSRQGRLLFVLSFAAANTLSVFWSWNLESNLPALYECFAASVIFLLIPARGMSAAVLAVQKPALGSGETGLRRYTAQRTRELADAFRELYETVRQSAEANTNDADVATVYDRAAESVCSGCRQKSVCWNQEYMDTLTILNDATAAMQARGHLELSDLPERFRERCASAEAFQSAVNAELRASIYRRRLKARLEENRCAAYGQYRYLAGVLDAVAEDLKNAAGPDALAERRLLRYLNARDIDADVAVFRDQSGRLRAVIESARLSLLFRETEYMDKISALLGARMCRPASANRTEGRLVLLEAEPLAVSVGVAAMKKEGEPVSGDRGTYFKTEQGVLCVLLSDGMGSGEKAARESISAVRILERFLRAGVEPGTAMKILNSVMLLKNGDHWGYATVDLMCIDLFTGQTGFYKYGAAPSYIRTGKTVRRVRGVSMAAGVLAGEGEPPDVVRMRLKPGGVALIASDGVVTREDDGWVREMLAEFDGSDTREFARSVIRKAGALYGYTDDMTVLVVRVEERK